MIVSTDKILAIRQSLVLATTNSPRAALTCRQFRRRGWQVHVVTSGPELRQLARILMPDLVLLDADLRGESGWLTCAKLKLELPRQDIILVNQAVTSYEQAFARFVGAAAIVPTSDASPELLEHVQQEKYIGCASA